MMSSSSSSRALQSAASLLLSALKRDNGALDEHPEVFLETTAKMLAEGLGVAPKRVRSLTYNLPRNEDLRHALLSGALTPNALCSMDTSEWAPAGIKRAREAAAERSEAQLRIAATGGELFSRTHSVRCPECGGSRARFQHRGTDLKDWHGRKNEVWGTKHDGDDDGADCLIICMLCDHSWNGVAPEVASDDEGGKSDDLEEARRKDFVPARRTSTLNGRKLD